MWVRLDTGFPSNHKTLALIAEGAKGRSAAFIYVSSLCYSGTHGLDGFIPHYALPVLQASKRDAELLVQHGFWEEKAQAGWQIKDWGQYQLSNEETQQRSERARVAAQIRWSRRNGANT